MSFSPYLSAAARAAQEQSGPGRRRFFGRRPRESPPKRARCRTEKSAGQGESSGSHPAAGSGPVVFQGKKGRTQARKRQRRVRQGAGLRKGEKDAGKEEKGGQGGCRGRSKGPMPRKNLREWERCCTGLPAHREASNLEALRRSCPCALQQIQGATEKERHKHGVACCCCRKICPVRRRPGRGSQKRSPCCRKNDALSRW